MTEAEKRLHRCVVAGNRPEKLGISEAEARAFLEREMLAAYRSGFNVFISGMSRGVDMWAAEIALDMKRRFEDVRLICAVPYDGFERHWQETDRKNYAAILACADLVVYTAREYFRGCCHVRNRWMIGHASRIIAVWNGGAGGTEYTLACARTGGLRSTVYICYK